MSQGDKHGSDHEREDNNQVTEALLKGVSRSRHVIVVELADWRLMIIN